MVSSSVQQARTSSGRINRLLLLVLSVSFIGATPLAEIGPGTSAPAPIQPPVSVPVPEAAPLSSTAERIYSDARPRLLQVRTLLAVSERQTTLGSAFLVNSDGLAVTNYHVVSQYALEPSTYRLEYVAPDKSRGPLTLLAIDVANDLAVVKLDKKDLPFFKFNDAVLSGESLKGERLYSMGNPLDLGFAIVEGTYNGLVDHSYNERIHFSGAINAGMSGGPTVTSDSRVIGVNVAKQVGGELVSFLVPARFVVPLIERARKSPPLPLADVRKEIGRELLEWQDGLYKALGSMDLRPTAFGPYQAPEGDANWFSCWANTNAGEVPKPRAITSNTRCDMNVGLFLNNEVSTGSVSIAHNYAVSVNLNPFQFSEFLNRSRVFDLTMYGNYSNRYFTKRTCHEDFVKPSGDHAPMMRIIWCVQGYRDFAGIYDVSMLAAAQDRSRETIISSLSMKGVSYTNAMSFARRFLEAIQWNK